MPSFKEALMSRKGDYYEWLDEGIKIGKKEAVAEAKAYKQGAAHDSKIIHEQESDITRLTAENKELREQLAGFRSDWTEISNREVCLTAELKTALELLEEISSLVLTDWRLDEFDDLALRIRRAFLTPSANPSIKDNIPEVK